MSVIRAQVQVQDPIGLHARPVSQIVELVNNSGLEILIGREGLPFAKANSALRLLALKVLTGETLIIEVPTADEGLADSITNQIQEILKG